MRSFSLSLLISFYALTALAVDPLALECPIHQLAFEYGVARVSSAARDLHDALNLDSCVGVLDPDQLRANEQAILTAAIPTRPSRRHDGPIIHISTTGSDITGTGSAEAPFASLHGAQAAWRSAGDAVSVVLAPGKYFLNQTLVLGPEDSGVSVSGPGAILSGGLKLNPDWKPSKLGPKILEADVDPALVQSDAERAHWASPRSDSAHTWGPPPATWNTLHVNSVRQVRARFPNGNPQHSSGICFSKPQRPGEGCPGYLTARGGASGSLPGAKSAVKISHALDRNEAPASPTPGGSYGTFEYTIYEPPDGHPVYSKPLPGLGWPNNSLFSFWGDPFSRGAGVNYGEDIQKNYSNPSTGVVHMFHSGLWGGWQYQVTGQQDRALMFGYGGFQEARGSGISTQHYFVENMIEELDSPGEWFYDPVGSKLFFWPNGSSPEEVVAPLLSTVVRVEGAQGVHLSGLQFTETRATYLEQYEVPSGGDWSVHRGAALELIDSKAVTVSECSFNQVGGNGVLLSNNVRESVIEKSEFVRAGDSGIVSLGSTDGIVGTRDSYPDRNIFRSNHIHEIGIYGKQTSCYFQAIGANNLLEDNLCYNGPRAGINWNDGFAGGSNVTGNLVFNMVRETGDHGPYNSWDRQPYLTLSGVEDGFPASAKFGMDASFLKARDRITKNFMINGYNGVWTLDHDDGSQRFNDTMNLLVWGGCKNYLGNHKSCDHNVILHPGIEQRASGSRRCQTDDNKVFQSQYHDNNHCVTADGLFYTMDISSCNKSEIDPHVYQTFSNTLYAPNQTFVNGPCQSFQEWQAAGQDRLSTVQPYPTVQEMVAMGKEVLGM